MAIRPNQVITSTTPPAVEILCKTVQVARTDTTAFEAFVLPKNAVVAGEYVLGVTASDAATTATLTMGVGTGTELLNAFDVKGATGQGYHPAGAASGSYIGTQLSADTLFKVKYAETGTASATGGPWLVKVEYYIPQQGFSF